MEVLGESVIPWRCWGRGVIPWRCWGEGCNSLEVLGGQCNSVEVFCGECNSVEVLGESVIPVEVLGGGCNSVEVLGEGCNSVEVCVFRWREGVGGYKPLEAVEVLSMRGKDLMIHSSTKLETLAIIVDPKDVPFQLFFKILGIARAQRSTQDQCVCICQSAGTFHESWLQIVIYTGL